MKGYIEAKVDGKISCCKVVYETEGDPADGHLYLSLAIEQCPLHKAAAELLEALKAVIVSEQKAQK